MSCRILYIRKCFRLYFLNLYLPLDFLSGYLGLSRFNLYPAYPLLCTCITDIVNVSFVSAPQPTFASLPPCISESISISVSMSPSITVSVSPATSVSISPSTSASCLQLYRHKYLHLLHL